MNALAITSKGLEEITSFEIKELINAKTEIKETGVIFQSKESIDLCTLCYKAQSVNKIIFLFNFFIFKNYNDFLKKLKTKIEKINFDNWLNNEV